MDTPERPSKRLKSAPVFKPLNTKPQFDLSSHRPNFSGKSSTNTPKSSTLITPSSSSDVKDKGKGKEKEVESVKITASIAQDDSNMLWVDRYAPTNRDTLGVHPKKVQNVADWLDEAFNPKLAKYRRILVISGPSGAAKTATLRILAKEVGAEILEFRNGNNLEFAGDYGRESMVNQLSSFLATAGMAPSLEFESSLYTSSLSQISLSSAVSQSNSSKPKLSKSKNQKRLILLEDLPNTSHYPTKLALRSALAQYLASPRVTCPLVMIVSEALGRPGVGPEAENTGGEGAARGESVDSRSVCGIDILENPGCREIKFNTIAVTIMKKALTKILDQIYNKSNPSGLSPSSRPSAQTLDSIISHSNGDIRSALMSLEFLASNPSARGVTNLAGGSSGETKGKKRKSPGGGAGAGLEEVQKLLQFVTARETSLFLFHALGKVLYNKRWGEDEKADKKDLDRTGIKQNMKVDRLPKHLRTEFTRAPSKVDPDVMFAEAPIDSDVFISYIHHNFPAFTESDDIEECQNIMQNFSLADGLMRMEGDEWLRRAALTSQYSFNVVVRGALLHLPSPIPKGQRVLRKSDLWENLRKIKANEESLDELYKKREGLGMTPGWTEEDGLGKVGGCQRSKRSLIVDFVPWFGKIWNGKEGGRRQTGAQQFLDDLGVFPPPPRGVTQTGEPIGEREVGEDDEDEKEAEENTEYNQDDEYVEVDLREEVNHIEELFDPDDDIVDSD